MEPQPPDPITRFAETNYRNGRQRFGIRLSDRFFHMYVIGKTGTGKSTLLETLIHRDLEQGHGLFLADPHGDLARQVCEAANRCGRAFTFLDLAQIGVSIHFNPLGAWSPRHLPLAVNALLDSFRRAWADSWGARLEYVLRNALFALTEIPGSTLPDVLRLLTDRVFRRGVAFRLRNAQVQDFWLKEFEAFPLRYRMEVIAPVQNKVGALLSHPTVHALLSHPESSFDVRTIMERGEVLIVSLAKGHIGEDAASLVGSLLLSQLAVAGLSRADLPEESRRPFFVHLDEFHSFATATLGSMLSELRKYRVGLVLAHQYLGQLDEVIRDAVLGNVGTMIVFRLGAADASYFAREFFPEITVEDLVGLPNRTIYLKLMIGGQVSAPFSGNTVLIETAGQLSK